MSRVDFFGWCYVGICVFAALSILYYAKPQRKIEKKVMKPDRTNNETFVLWVIFEHPNDYPDGYVVRKNYVTNGQIEIDSDAHYCPTLSAARALIPLGLVNIGRQPKDEWPIKEVWL